MEPEFNEAKFRELILFIAQECSGDPYFGSVKLNKILYFSDFYAYRKLGQAITGAVYQNLTEGPAPRKLLPIRRALLEEKAITMEDRHFFNRVQRRIVPLRQANLELFTDEELAIVREVIEALNGQSARDVSELSHAEIGWQLVGQYETIPYRTAWLSPEPLSQDEIEMARSIAEEHELEFTG